MAAIQSPGDGLVTPRRFRLTHDIAEVSHDRVDPVTLLPNRGDRALSFFIPKTSSRCVDFSNIQLHLRLRLVSGLEGNPLNPDKSYVIPGFVPSTIFGSLAVRVNDTEITNASQYPILSRFLMLTQMEAGRREVLQQVNHFEGWDEENVNQRQMMVEVEEAVETDEGGEGEDGAENSAAADPPKKRRKVKVWTMLGNRFPNYKTRSNRFTREGGRGSTTYSSYLITELSGGSAEKALVLPPCDIALDFIPAEPGRAVITDVENPDVRVEIMEAHLSVPRILPKGGSIPRSLRWNFHRTKITPIIIPKDRMEFHAAITYSGLIGRRISLLLMDHDNWEGNFRSSIYRSHNFNVDSIELHVGSRVLPTTRIRANFERRETNEMYMYVLDSLKWSLRRTGAGPSMLEKSEWEQGSFLWSADTSVDRRAGAGYKGHPEAGSINLSVSFHKKTPDQLVAVVVSEATAELRMESDGSVKVLFLSPISKPLIGEISIVLGVGKTTALLEIIKAGDKTLERAIDELVVVFTQNQPAYVEMANHVAMVKLVRLDKLETLSLPEFIELVGGERKTSRTRGIIFDDIEQSKGSGIWRIVLECVTRLAHHLDAFCFFTSHLLFVEKQEFRVIQRNSAYILLFPSVRDRSSVGILARRCFPEKPALLTKAFAHLLKNSASLSYVILDLRPRICGDLLRIRHSFRLDAPLVAYLGRGEEAVGRVVEAHKTRRLRRKRRLPPQQGGEKEHASGKDRGPRRRPAPPPE